MKFTLSRTEKLFCRCYAELGSISEAAEAAGICGDGAYETASEILEKPQARRLIRSQRSYIRGNGIDDLRAALRRIAFGSANDAAELVLSEENQNVRGADMFCVRELKKVKGGGVELKTESRIDAIKLLYEIECAEQGRRRSDSFLSALKGASCKDGEDDFPD